jgi:hypothetical protein
MTVVQPNTSTPYTEYQGKRPARHSSGPYLVCSRGEMSTIEIGHLPGGLHMIPWEGSSAVSRKLLTPRVHLVRQMLFGVPHAAATVAVFTRMPDFDIGPRSRRDWPLPGPLEDLEGLMLTYGI